MRRKIIIDTDPGIDDAFAIALASKYEHFEILGITSSMGNKGIENTTINAVKLAKYFNSNCKVYKGEKSYISNNEEITADDVHGDDGLGGIGKELDFDKNILSEKTAVDFILESIKKYPNEIEIIALAPLTNIAKAIEKDFETMKNLKCIYSMGGGINRGNITPFAEFNYYVDPKAVQMTYTLGNFVDIYMLGLDVTHDSLLTCNDLFFIKKANQELGTLLHNLAQEYLNTYWSYNEYLGCVMHDLLVVAYAIDKNICPTTKIAKLTVPVEGEKIGATLCDFNTPKENKNVIVPTSVHSFNYKKLFIKILFGKETEEKYDRVTKAMELSNNNLNLKLSIED